MKLNYRRTILIGFAFLSICVFWQFYDNEIPKILTYTFGLGETATGAIMALDNVLALFMLPLFGTLSDKTDTKIGKRMPYILIGTALSAVFLFLLITVGNKPGNVVIFIILLLALLVSMGIYRSPAVSLMPDLTPAPLRSSANAIINLMGTVGAIYALVMIKLLLHDAEDQSQTDYFPLMMSIVIFMVAAVVILYFTINEKKVKNKVAAEYPEYASNDADNTSNDSLDNGDNKSEDKSDMIVNTEIEAMPSDVKKSLICILLSVFFWYTAYNAVTTAFSRYVGEVWGLKNGAYADCLMIATVAAVISYIPIGVISSKIGRKKTILTGVVLMSICYLVAALIPSFNSSISFLFAVIGFGWAAINVNSYPMVVEMSKSSDIGKYTGTYYTFSMAAQVFTPIFSGFLLEHISYRTLFPYAFTFSCLAFITMMMVKHGDSRPDKKKNKLENFEEM
jgi:MFS family permease